MWWDTATPVRSKREVQVVMAGFLGHAQKHSSPCLVDNARGGGLATGIMPEEHNGRRYFVLPGRQAVLAITLSVSCDLEPWASS